MDECLRVSDTKQERDLLLHLILDAYRRMATNTEKEYRTIQKQKCDRWLSKLTALWEKNPFEFTQG